MDDEMVEQVMEKNTSSIEVTELWKYLSVIAVSCAISFAGHFLTSTEKYMTEDQVDKVITSKQLVLQTEMKHYDGALGELKKVVENNNTVMQGVREELAVMRSELKEILNKNGNK